MVFSLIAGCFLIVRPLLVIEVAEGRETDDDPPADGPPPGVLVATMPTEPIVTGGTRAYSPLSGTDLLYIANSESDVLLDIQSQQHFVVLSGRWFVAPSIEGPDFERGGRVA